MRADLSTIQQTLTPEAACVLTQSISEAARRNHAQTTPLHVAATLLASPSGFLRQACVRSHPNSSHPLQCRALELCFSVALDRLPAAQSSSSPRDPPVSNALMAALKRAQAHQRRGCPETQQQPLLAVKVELEQLIISILDDPSVSRVMKEASFSSPAVKAAIERTLTNNGNNTNNNSNNRNLYVNPRLQQNAGLQLGHNNRSNEVRRVMEILKRSKKKNPVLVGESEPEIVAKELVRRIENGELLDRGKQVLQVDKELGYPARMADAVTELRGLIETQMESSGIEGGIVLDLGDLKWLVEQGTDAEMGRKAVEEIRKLLDRFGSRVWLIGTATCETYLRCQVYHPSMESDLDLQAVPIAAARPPGMVFPRFGNNGILSSSVESLSPFRNLPTVVASPPPRRPVENVDPMKGTALCPQCAENYEKDLEKASSEAKLESAQLPPWLLSIKANNGQVKPDTLTPKAQELQRKWIETCLRRHPSYHGIPSLSAERITPTPLSMTSLCSLFPRQPKLQSNRVIGDSVLQLNSSLSMSMLAEKENNVSDLPESPVRTDLMLGPHRTVVESVPESRFNGFKTDKITDSLDVDSFKRLLKGLSEKVWWQHDAASAVAATVSQCKLGNRKRRGGVLKGDSWLLFVGPDKTSKKKMASALSELVSGASPITINLGSKRDDGESDFGFRGKTILDRVAEVVKRNPSSVIVFEDVHDADIILRGSIKKAMERGRLTDSHGREIGLGNVIFILMANWSPERDEMPRKPDLIDEAKLQKLVAGGWQLRLSYGRKVAKRRPDWLYKEEERPRKETRSQLFFDLNEAADAGDEKADGSPDSSDLTIDHDQDELGSTGKISPRAIPSTYHDLANHVDDAILFNHVNFRPIKRSVANSLNDRFSKVVGDGISFEIQDEAVEKVAVGIWFAENSLDEWIGRVFNPSLCQLRSELPSETPDEPLVVRLELDEDSGDRSVGDVLPERIRVVAR